MAYSWGMGTNYQLGNGTDEDMFEPTLVSGAQIKNKTIIKVSSGGQHTVFLALNNS
jgi:regulator of chromosome condensation